MTGRAERVLVFHTAFIGDIVLMFPMLQELRYHFPHSRITVVTIPAVADLVRQHRAVDEVLPYDKHGVHRGWGGMRSLALHMRNEQFSLALVPHRSLRSAVIVRMARIPRRIGFTTSAGARLFSELVEYKPADHEIDRNLALLQPIIGRVPARVLPVVGVSDEDVRAADAFLEHIDRAKPGFARCPLIAFAPGSVWSTKRWPAENFAALAQRLGEDGFSVVLVGGERDKDLCRSIEARSNSASGVSSAAGDLTLTGSAALLRRCRMLVSNDSAPMHIAMGVGIPVLALFGPTVPAIGFAPVGPRDRVLEVKNLTCRPCNIHGGNECPIGSFECMRGIPVAQVWEAVHRIIADKHQE